MSQLKSLGGWLRANPVRPFGVIGVLIALNILSATLLSGTVAAVISGNILAATILLAAAYVLGGRS